MGRTLKEIFGIREMSIEVPDDEVMTLKRYIAKGVQSGDLPSSAKGWFRGAKGTKAPAVTPASNAAEPQTGRQFGTDPNHDFGTSVSPKPKKDDGGDPHDRAIGRFVQKGKDSSPRGRTHDDDDEDTGLDPSLFGGMDVKAPTQFKAKDNAADMFGVGDPFAKKGDKDKPKSGDKPPPAPKGMPNMLPHPKDASFKVHDRDADGDAEYSSPFNWGNIGHFGGGSSWDAAAASASDPESMPRAGGGWGKMKRKSDDWLGGTPFGDDADDGALTVGQQPNFTDVDDKKTKKALAKPQKKGKLVGGGIDSKKAGNFDIDDITGDGKKKSGLLSKIFGKKDKTK